MELKINPGVLKRRTGSSKLKKQKKINEKKVFYDKLMLRAASRPINKTNKVIELARKIVQLLLLSYQYSMKTDSIKNLLRSLTRKRSMIYNLGRVLKNLEISQNTFIIFCYWYLNEFPAKVYKASGWVLEVEEGAVPAYIKFRSSRFDFEKEIQDFAESKERGQKLIRLLGKEDVVEEQDEIFDKIKNI